MGIKGTPRLRTVSVFFFNFQCQILNKLLNAFANRA